MDRNNLFEHSARGEQFELLEANRKIIFTLAFPPGRIVVALIDGEATIKRLVRGQDYFVLQPESTSQDHQPIVLDRDAVIQGTVCRVLKRGSQLLGIDE